MELHEYHSPRHKLVSLFKAGRDLWHQRANQYHRRLRQLEIRVRDLEASRAHWRHKYSQSQPTGQTESSPFRPESPLPGL